MSGAKIAFLHGLPPEIVDLITPYTPDDWVTEVVNRDTPIEEQKAIVSDADFLLVYGVRLHDDVLRAAEKARLVQLLAAGYDRMNLSLMAVLEVPCANNGGANSWAVADHAVLLMLALYKQQMHADPATREGRWNAPITGSNTFEMADKLVGVLGLGNIGRKVARRVQGFDALVQYYDTYPIPEEEVRSLGYRRVTLDELFRTSDILTRHTPLTPQTHHIVNSERLALMKPTAVLINTSRGPVVDEVALIEALQEGKIAGAGLDVFEQEPVDPANPLLKMNNVVVTPHMAGTTWNTWFRRAEFAYQNMERVWNGEEPLATVQEYD